MTSGNDPDFNGLLRRAFARGVAAVHPDQCLPGFIPPVTGPCTLVGVGKAACSMARQMTHHYPEPVSGLVVVPRGQPLSPGVALPGITVLEAAHPVPDASSARAGERVLELVSNLAADDQLVVLLSGGGSALLVQPAAGISLADKQEVTRQLLASGATIGEINCVRKKLSAIKGGRLARAAAPAGVHVLLISDVPGDVVADIASGPFSPDTSTLADARSILSRYGCRVGKAVASFLEDPRNESPKPGDPAFARVSTRVCARSADAVAAAAAEVSAAGFEPVLMDDSVNGPAVAVAEAHAQLACQYRAAGRQVALISGGETTVRVNNPAGRGGRNTHYLLALALALAGTPGAWALAGDTDGVDGTGHNAGAVLRPDSLQRAARLGLDPGALLERNLAFDFFSALDDLLVTGPTGTNANDLRIVLVDPRPGSGRDPRA